MRHFLTKLLCFIARWVFSLRYRVELKGIDLFKDECFKDGKGVLFLPNHPAHIDPIILVIYLWPAKEFRPLAIEYMYRQPVLHSFMRLFKTLPIPNFETSVNDIKLQKAEQVMKVMERGLNHGQNYLIYPAGRLKHTGKEVIGGASAAHQLLQKCPESHLILIRSIGLWGSRFSRGLTGQSPPFMKMMVSGLVDILKNFIFFMPRRHITIEMSKEPDDFPRKGTKIEVNRYLEKWYNQYPSEMGTIVTEEPLNLVPSLFYKESLPSIAYTEKRKKVMETLEVCPELEKIVYEQLSKISGHKIAEIKREMSLSLDLGLDSLDIAQVVVFISDHFEVGEVHPDDLDTVQDALEVAAGREKSLLEEEEEKEVVWEKEKRPAPQIPQGKTIIEAFFNVCDRMRSLQACGDDLVGILTYSRLKMAVLALAVQIEKFSGDKIGILLPATSGSYIVILATLVAKKTPVMLNWTLGPRYLNHMMEVTEIKVVLSSWKFLEKLSYVEVGDLAKKIHLLENIKKKITPFQKVKAAILAKFSADHLIKMLNLSRIKPEDPAVILFTSGTEATPKGVPLSHKNLLENQRAAMQCVGIKADDVFFGILPPFHSFGFSVAGLLPLLMGVRVAYYPDPTNSHGLAKGILRWKVSIFCSAPSFLKGLFQVASKKDLKSIRLFVSGAEKTPKELFDYVKSLGSEKLLLEGYGITECAPIISITRPNEEPRGVGKPIPGIEIRTIHPETKEILGENQEGELCVAGSNVFSGYLEQDKDPFVIIDEKKFYRTGDLGHVDKEGFLILSGRMKRFTKIGGEMISLGALEEAVFNGLVKKGVKGDKAQVAVLGSEEDNTKSFLVLFTTQDIDKKEANLILREAGFSRIVKISQTYKLHEIPLMGSGKVDYRKLQALVQTLENE